jgi:hypothetical protein
MKMSFTFYGPWAPTILTMGVLYQERVRIAGSVSSDGLLTGPPGATLPAIDGGPWEVFMEYSTDGGVTWLQSPTVRTPYVTPAEGLGVDLSSFYDPTKNLVEGAIVHFVYLNREINPLGPTAPPFGFTLPPGSFRTPRPVPKPPEGCCSCCGERRCSCQRRKASRRP